KHRAVFPVDVNRADREMLLRVPGLGAKTVDRIVAARRVRAFRMADLARLRVNLRKVGPFITAVDHHPRAGLLDRADLRALLVPRDGLAERASVLPAGLLARPVQLPLFGAAHV
ncbi:MAG TPA: helix-hairpin-helix domain-containing protein, partial [Roseomonas sp.]